MAITLEALAVEIFGLIFDHLSIGDINSFSKTSQNFHALALPFLYHTILFDWTRPRSQHRFLLFLGTILHKPDLAIYIKRLTLESAIRCMPGRFWTPNWKSLWEDEFQESMENAIKKFGHASRLGSVRDGWLQKCVSGNSDALIGLMICHLSELKSLSLSRDILVKSHFVATVLAESLLPRCGTQLPKFAGLREVKYCSDSAHVEDRGYYNQLDLHTYSHTYWAFQMSHPFGYQESISIDTALAFFYLPDINNLTLFLADPPAMFQWPDSPPLASSLRSLTLHHSEAKEETLAALLSRTPKLESLRYDYHINTGQENESDTRKVAQCLGSKIGEAIQHVSKTLKHLSISVVFFNRQHMEIEGDHCRFPTSIGSLLHMTRLESLEINVGLLFGWNGESSPDLSLILPRNLQSLLLELEHYTGNVISHEECPWEEDHLMELFASLSFRCDGRLPPFLFVRA